MVFLASALPAKGQGSFVFDQQSSTDEMPIVGGIQLPGSPSSGDGQSFTPSLTSVGFVRLLFSGGGGATVYVNLRSDSILGPIIGTTSPVTMGLSGARTFYSPTPVSITPGTSYYIEPVEQSGTAWDIIVGQYNYAGRNAFSGGSLQGPVDYWFREGIVVPEPSSSAMLLIVSGGFLFAKRTHHS